MKLNFHKMYDIENDVLKKFRYYMFVYTTHLAHFFTFRFPLDELKFRALKIHVSEGLKG